MPRFDIPFTINGETQTITATGNRTIRAGSKNYWYAVFSFVDEDFDNLSHLSATFSNEPHIRNRGRAKVVPLEYDEVNVTPNTPPVVTKSVTVYHTATCRIPWEVLTRKGKVYVGIFAGDMLVTNEAEIEVTFAAPTLGEESQPTAGWYERFETDLAAKQDKLTAGENITITEEDVISAEGGGGTVTVDSVNGQTGAVVLDADDVGAIAAPNEVTVQTSGAVTQECADNTIYTFTGALTSLTLTQATGAREYLVIFTTGSTAPTVTFPSGVVLPDTLTIEANKRYEVSVRDGYAVAQSWEVSA